jgi:hypothetical protein
MGNTIIRTFAERITDEFFLHLNVFTAILMPQG